MKNPILKSIGAIAAGFIFIGVTHNGTDVLLKATGVLPKDNLYTSASVILFVIFYRAFFSLIGSYIAARLAPNKPMNHALIIGCIGTLLSIVGAIVTADMHLGPAWYAWSLAVIAMPVAWAGGKLCVMRNKEIKSPEA